MEREGNVTTVGHFDRSDPTKKDRCRVASSSALSQKFRERGRTVGAGFYYDVTLRISALSDEDMEEIEQFLAGGPATPARPERSSIGRSFRRFLLRLAGLPGEELTVKTERFRVR